MTTNKLHLASLTTAVALALSACGGGSGGNTRPTPPPTTPPPAPTCQDSKAENFGGALPCVYPKPKCEDATAENFGKELPCTYRYNGFKDNILVPINADIAHAEGYTGKGVKVGVLDGVPTDRFTSMGVQATWYKDYTDHPGESDGRGHGDIVASVIVGQPGEGGYRGGVAPEADLYWGGICWEGMCDEYGQYRAMNDMVKEGVRLFNASFGSSTGGVELDYYVQKFILPILKNADGLIVYASGNAGLDQPSSSVLVPVFDSSAEKHWLAVGAVDVDAKGNITGKSDYSNACGAAAQWCLVAPGESHLLDAGNPGDWLAAGTSFAAPRVTGAAALVWQAFPWMSAANVHDTILTTATDLGDEGVDAIFGWGLLNAAKAAHGPAQFVEGGFSTNVTNGYASTFSNDISGVGGLTKQGSGSLTLTGNNTYTGGTKVEAGTLALSGTLGSSVNVTGGTFESLGGKINGDYTVSADGTTGIQVGTGLSITGKANLDGDLVLLPERTGYTVKPTETLLTADAVLGVFGEVKYGSGFFYDASLHYTANSITADLTRKSAAASAMSFSLTATTAIEGGKQADSFLAYVERNTEAGVATQQEQAMAVALSSAVTEDEAMASLASLTGELHGTARTVGVQHALSAGDLLGERTRSLGTFGNTGVWAQADGSSDKLQRTGYSAASSSREGLMVGVDVALDDGLTIGAALGGGHGDVNLDGLGGRIKTTDTTLAVYGRSNVGKSGYVAGNLSYTDSALKEERSVLVGGNVEGVTGKHSDSALQARIEAGWSLASGITPYVGAGVLRHKQGGFSEVGGAGFGLTAGSDTFTTQFADGGVRFGKTLGRWFIGGDVSARHLFGNANTGFTGAFTGATGAVFDVAGQALAKDSFRALGNAFYTAGNGWVWYLTAGTERGAGQRNNTFATAGVKVGF